MLNEAHLTEHRRGMVLRVLISRCDTKVAAAGQEGPSC
jgi:hypothetical protein